MHLFPTLILACFVCRTNAAGVLSKPLSKPLEMRDLLDCPADIHNIKSYNSRLEMNINRNKTFRDQPMKSRSSKRKRHHSPKLGK